MTAKKKGWKKEAAEHEMLVRMRRVAKTAIDVTKIRETADIAPAMKLLLEREKELRKIEVARRFKPGPDDKLKLFVWDDAEHLRFALAYSADHARALLQDEHGINLDNNLKSEPGVYDEPYSHALYVGE